MGYHNFVAYCNKRTRTKKQERRNFMEMMEHRLRAPNDHQIIQLGPQDCNQNHLHVPDRYNQPQAQQQPTFE